MPLTTIQDGTVDTSTSLSLVGRWYADYGTIIATDLVHMLENSANVFPPVKPLMGQFWYDSSINTMKVWNGSIWYSVAAVTSVLGNVGAISLAQMVAGGMAPLLNPDFTGGIPLGPTAPVGTSTTQFATTAFVISQMATVASGVSSVIGLTGAITLNQLTIAGLAPSVSPALTGEPTAPTAVAGTATTQLATTAFVQDVIAATQTALTAYINSQIRVRLTAGLTLYVSPTGSDSATGTLAAPFLTMQNAYVYLYRHYDLNGYAATIQLSDGIYAAGLTANQPVVGQIGPIHVVGNVTIPANVIVNSTPTQVNTFGAVGSSWLSVSGMTLNSSGIGQGGYCLVAQQNGIIFFNNIDFGAAVAGHIITNYGGFIQCFGDYKITGSAPCHLIASTGGNICYDGSGGAFTITVVLQGAPQFATAFIDVDGNASAQFSGTTFSGAATGKRFSITNGGFVSVGLLVSQTKASFFPGTVGVTGTGDSSTGYYNAG
jgi:hypothetical protein